MIHPEHAVMQVTPSEARNDVGMNVAQDSGVIEAMTDVSGFEASNAGQSIDNRA